MWKINGDDRIPCQTETTTGNVKLISSDAHNKLLEESILKHKRIWKKLSQSHDPKGEIEAVRKVATKVRKE